MAEIDKPTNFYLAGIDPTGENTHVHSLIARAAERAGAVILNPHRTDHSSMNNVNDQKKASGEIARSIAVVKQAHAYGGYYGLRTFQTEYELGALHNVPGVIFTDMTPFPVPQCVLGEGATVVHLPYKDDRETIDREISALMEEQRPLIIKRKLMMSLVQTGELLVNTAGEYALYKFNKLPLTAIEYKVLERLAMSLDDVVPFEDVFVHTRSEEVLKKWQNPVKGVATAVAQLHKMLNDRRYLERYKGVGYRLVDLKRYEEAAPTGILQNGPIKIDLIHGNVFFNEIPIDLDNSQRRLLTNMVMGKGKTLGMEEASQYVWGGIDHPVKHRTVQSELNQIGTKLKLAGLEPIVFKSRINEGYTMTDLSTS